MKIEENMKNGMYVCFVRHEDESKQYLFDCTELRYDIWPGCNVVCDTFLGNSDGIVTSSPLRIEGAYRDMERLIESIGGYVPLKKVISVQIMKSNRLTEADREQIAKDWLRDRLNSDLPF